MTAPTATRRFRLTPAWLIFGLLVVEGLLWLSERYRWFWFNERKGWTVLMAVAVAIAFLAGTLLLWAVGHAWGWRNHFRIRLALPMGLAVGIPFIWFSLEMGRAVRHRQLADAISKSHGGVRYNYWFDKDGNFLQNARPPEPRCLYGPLSVDFFADIVWVGLDSTEVTGTLIAQLKQLEQLRWLWLNNAHLTDANLEELEGLSNLRELHLKGTRTTEAEVQKLQQALPNCKIIR